MLRKCLISGAVVASGDILCQVITQRSQHPKESAVSLDIARTTRFGIAGATLHAPFWFYGFRLMDKLPLGAPSLMSAAFRRAVATQILLSPPYFILFYGWIGVMEQSTTSFNYQQIVDTKTPAVIDTVTRGLIFWPVVNMINFRYVLPSHRLHYVTVAGVFWNAAVSYANDDPAVPVVPVVPKVSLVKS